MVLINQLKTHQTMVKMKTIFIMKSLYKIFAHPCVYIAETKQIKSLNCSFYLTRGRL